MALRWITTRDFANRAFMLTQAITNARGLADLPEVRNDSLLALIALANDDPRPEKIDVGVGVFRDAGGNTPILKVMKEAEQRLLDSQTTKAYLGSAGDKRFAGVFRPVRLGAPAAAGRRGGMPAGLRADRTRQCQRACVRRHAHLAEPSAADPRRQSRAGRI